MKRASHPKILVVDDDPAVAECIQHFLADAGYVVDMFTDSSAALARLAGKPDGYAILVSDNSMPHLGGAELIAAARKAGFRGGAIVYSGSVSPDDEAEFKSIGADVILRKPFDLKLLVPTVADLLARAAG